MVVERNSSLGSGFLHALGLYSPYCLERRYSSRAEALAPLVLPIACAITAGDDLRRTLSYAFTLLVLTANNLVAALPTNPGAVLVLVARSPIMTN